MSVEVARLATHARERLRRPIEQVNVVQEVLIGASGIASALALQIRRARLKNDEPRIRRDHRRELAALPRRVRTEAARDVRSTNTT
jgi:hypothetical protein